MGDSPHNVNAVETTLEILERMRVADSMSVSELAQQLDRPKSTVHRHLSTLREQGYIQRKDTRYKLGLQFLNLAEHARIQNTLYSVVKPEVDDLIRTTGERAQVMVEENNRGVYIYQQEGEKAIRTDSHIGKRVYLHSVASGKAYLAFLPNEQVEEIIKGTGLPTLTNNTITDRETLYEVLNRVRDRGYAFNDEEEMNGIRAVGAPILNDNDGEVVGSLSIAAPKTRFHGELYLEEIPKRVTDIATILGVKTTYD